MKVNEIVYRPETRVERVVRGTSDQPETVLEISDFDSEVVRLVVPAKYLREFEDRVYHVLVDAVRNGGVVSGV